MIFVTFHNENELPVYSNFFQPLVCPKSLLIVAFLFYICYILPMRQKAVTIYYSGESLSISEMSAEGVQQEYMQNISCQSLRQKDRAE